jgi:acyl-CoA synthetase (NDP forming)
MTRLPSESLAAHHVFSNETTSRTGYSVERMVDLSRGVELIIGCKRDPRFGPIVLVGFGGIYAELTADTAVALAPAEPAELENLLRSLRGAALLTGARGRPPLALAAAAEAAAALSRLSAERPDVSEVEVNPLLVTSDGVVGLDARVIVRAST